MTISLSIDHARPDFDLNLQIDAPDGVTALFGPSGAGKTTIVNIVAGLERPKSGKIVIAGDTLLDTDAGIDVPRHRRGIGYVFQDARLFPHMTVARNIAFGARFAQSRNHRATLPDVLSLLGLEDLMERRPWSLSGGEAQRVGIARALMAAPRLLLLDEPLAALDAARRQEILPYLERIRDRFGIPMLYVSHALSEVARLANTVVVLDRGRVVQVGPPQDVLSHPVAPLGEAGALISARVVGHDPDDGLTELATSSGTVFIPRTDVPPDAPIRLRVSANDIMISLSPPDGLSALNVLPASVESVEIAGDTAANVHLRSGDDQLVARLTRRSVRRLDLTPGTTCFAVIKSMTVSDEDVGRSE